MAAGLLISPQETENRTGFPLSARQCHTTEKERKGILKRKRTQLHENCHRGRYNLVVLD